MKLKKNIRNAGVGLLVSALAIGTAFAWLTNSDTATKHNDIKVGRVGIVFENQENAVSLVDNTAIPMTKAYAVGNLTAYTFDISNVGDVVFDYSILISATDYTNSFADGKVDVLIAPIADDASVDDIKAALQSAAVQKVSADKNLYSGTLNGMTHQKYALLAYVDSETTLAEYTGKSVSFKLEVQGTQHTDAVVNYEYYNNGIYVITKTTYDSMPEVAKANYTGHLGDVYQHTATYTNSTGSYNGSELTTEADTVLYGYDVYNGDVLSEGCVYSTYLENDAPFPPNPSKTVKNRTELVTNHTKLQ